MVTGVWGDASRHGIQRRLLELPDLNGSVVTLHPMIHAFYADGAEGDMTMVLTDDEHPLVKWALETRQALEHCAKPD